RAMDTWRAMITAQGGDVDAPLPEARHVEQVRAESDGVVTGLDARAVGVAAWRLGARRSRRGEAVQAAAGGEITRHIGEQVRAESDGAVTGRAAMAVGVAAWRLGAGRSRPGEAVQAAAGVEITRHIGEQVRAGDVLARLHTDTPERIARAAQAIDGAWDLAA